jgi:hypothetical protein
MIADRDRKPAGEKHHQKQHDLEGIQTEEPEVSRNSSQGQKQSANKKRTD